MQQTCFFYIECRIRNNKVYSFFIATCTLPHNVVAAKYSQFFYVRKYKHFFRIYFELRVF